MRLSVLSLVARWGFLTLLASPLLSAAQPATMPAPPARRVEQHPLLRPKYPGGQRALRTYLTSEIRYPLAAYREHVVGKVYVQFIVDEAGVVREPVVMKGIGFGCDEEALRLVQSLLLFRPGTNAAGQAVAVYETTIVDFRLDGYVTSGHPMPSNSGPVLPELGGSTLVPFINQSPLGTPLKVPAPAPLAGAGTLAAQYPGGLSELFVFIAKHTHYPRAARKADVEGRVLVSVLVDEGGRVTNPIVTQGLGYGCDEEAVRVMGLLFYRFSPAQNNAGQAVASRVEVPVFFPKMKLGKYRRSQGKAWHQQSWGNPLPVPYP